MGTVYRETYTKPLPPDAELFTRKGERFARFKDAKGRSRTEAVTTGAEGTDRLLIVAGTYTAKYRDGSGLIRKVATGCRDKTAAESVLKGLEIRSDKVRSGLRTQAEDTIVDRQRLPIESHLALYDAHLEATGASTNYRKNTMSQLRRLMRECEFRSLVDFDCQRVERWLVDKAKPSVDTATDKRTAGLSARTRNSYRTDLVTFVKWCVAENRLLDNPFVRLPVVDEKSDRRRQRRAMTEAELVKLLDVAQRRPLLDAMTVRRGKYKGQAVGKLTDATRDRLERLGRERALIYKTLVLTGLRKGELASLTVGQLELDGPVPYAVLHAADEKNRQGSSIPLRSDLADDLRAWLDDKLAVLRVDSLRRGEIVPSRLSAAVPLFTVPDKLVKILDRDLKAAGIAKRDERGRTLDVHALRHSFGTLLSKAGVTPRTAQAAMRHSRIDLTMNVYTDPKLLDVGGAVESLPSLPLSTGPQSERIAVKATGTDDMRASPLVPVLVPKADFWSKSETVPDKTADATHARNVPDERDATSSPVKEKRSLTTPVNERRKGWLMGFEPTTLRATI